MSEESSPADTLELPAAVQQRHCRARARGATFYRVRLLVPCRAVSPDYDRRRPISDDNWPTRVLPAGTELSDPEAWILCCPHGKEEEIRAEPLDEATRAKVAEFLARRETILADRLAQQEQALRARSGTVRDPAEKSRRRKPDAG